MVMTANAPFRIFLIDTVSTWLSIGAFLLCNFVLGAIAQNLVPTLDKIYFIGFTTKASFAALIVGPLFVYVLRRFGKNSLWDILMWSILLTVVVMALRYGSCGLNVFDSHVYVSSFDPKLSYHMQCAYFSLLNFVLGVPKTLLTVLVLVLCRNVLGALFRVQVSSVD